MRVQLILERILVFEPIERGGRGIPRGDEEYRHEALPGTPAQGDVTLAQRRDRVVRKLHREASDLGPVKTKSGAQNLRISSLCARVGRRVGVAFARQLLARLPELQLSRDRV